MQGVPPCGCRTADVIVGRLVQAGIVIVISMLAHLLSAFDLYPQRWCWGPSMVNPAGCQMAWWGESARKRRVGTWQIWSGATSSREGLTHIGRTGGRGTTLVTNVDGRVTDGVTAHDAPEGAGVAEVGCDPPTATERIRLG